MGTGICVDVFQLTIKCLPRTGLPPDGESLPLRRTANMSTKIAEFTAHPIDLAKAEAVLEPIPKDAELDSYLKTLLEWAYDGEDDRQFFFAEMTTEVRAAIQEVIVGKKLVSVAGTIANRLLKQEKATHEAVEHLKGMGVRLISTSRHSSRGRLSFHKC